MRKFRIAFLLIVILTLAGFYYFDPVRLESLVFNAVKQAKPANSWKIELEPVALDSKLSSVLHVPPEEMLSALDNSYRLYPDRRFLKAFDLLHQIFSGDNPGSAFAWFDNGKWNLRYGEDTLGTLPEFPDYSDFEKLLTDWTLQLNEKYPLNIKIDKQPHPLEEAHATHFLSGSVARLKQVDQDWLEGNRSSRLLFLAASDLARLSFHTLDKLGDSNQVVSQALALVSVARALTPNNLDRERCLLAVKLRYGKFARKVATALGKNDPVRQYVFYQDRKLKKLAEKKGAPEETRFLWLDRLAEKEEFPAWRSLADDMLKQDDDLLPLLYSAMTIRSHAVLGNFPQAIRSGILYSMERAIEEEHPEAVKENENRLEWVLERFENDAESIRQLATGPFFTEEMYVDYYRVPFYSTIHAQALYHLDQQNSPEASRQFSSSLENGAGSILVNLSRGLKGLSKGEESGKDFLEKTKNYLSNLGKSALGKNSRAWNYKVWLDHLIDSNFAQGNVQELVKDLTELPYLGGEALNRSLKEAKKYFHFGDPAPAWVLKRFAYRLDSRPGFRLVLASHMNDSLNDLKRSEILYRSALESCPDCYPFSEVWFWNFTGNKKALVASFDKPHFPIRVHTVALGYLESMAGKTRSGELNRARKLAARYPNSWQIQYAYSKILEKQKQYKEASRVVRRWQKRKVEIQGLELSRSHERLAQLFEKTKQWDRAQKALHIPLQTGTGAAYDIQARVLEAKGNLKEAEKYLRYRYKRYSSSLMSLNPLLGFLWRHSRYQEAADLLNQFPYTIRANDWSHKIGPVFAKAFSRREAEEGLAAFELLDVKTRFPSFATALAHAVQREGNPELAFRMVTQLKAKRLEQLSFYVVAYIFLKEWQGEKTAMDWLKTAIPQVNHNPGALMMYQEKKFDLLWKFVRGPDAYTHLLRAAALPFYKSAGKKERKALMDYYQLPSIKRTHYGIMGMYLMGLASKEEVLAAMDSPRKRCEFAYFLGLKAFQEGRIHEASDWYRVTLETGLRMNGEFVWATGELLNWRRQNRSLDLLEFKRS